MGPFSACPVYVFQDQYSRKGWGGVTLPTLTAASDSRVDVRKETLLLSGITTGDPPLPSPPAQKLLEVWLCNTSGFFWSRH